MRTQDASCYRRAPTWWPAGTFLLQLAVGRHASTRSTAASATQSSVESTGSGGTARSPPGTTDSRSAARRPSSSQPSTSGCDRPPSLELVVLGQFLPANAAQSEVGVLARRDIQDCLEPDHAERRTVQDRIE